MVLFVSRHLGLQLCNIIIMNNQKISRYIFILCITSLVFGKDPIDRAISKNLNKIIKMRHQIHQYPELGNREFKTSKLVADHLRTLGFEVETEIAHTGVVGILRGNKPGPVIAVRAERKRLPKLCPSSPLPEEKRY